MYQVVGVEDDEDLVFRREAVKSELERGYLIIEREGGCQDMSGFVPGGLKNPSTLPEVRRPL